MTLMYIPKGIAGQRNSDTHYLIDIQGYFAYTPLPNDDKQGPATGSDMTRRDAAPQMEIV